MISACKSAICLRASSNCPRASFKAARSLPHSGQEATGLARGSFIYYKDTELARNCNVFNDHQSLSRIIDARRGTGRLPLRLQKRPVLDYLYCAIVAHRSGLPAPQLLGQGGD